MTFEGKVVSILPRNGLNNGKNSLAIDQEESPDCLNVRFRYKSVKKRDGVTRYLANAAAAAAVTGLAQLSLNDGTAGQVCFCGDDAFRENSGAWSSIKGSVTLTAGQNYQLQFSQLTDLLICTNNVDPIVKWAGGSGNLALLGGSPPSAAGCVTAYKNYVILGNTVESAARVRERVRWSELNNAESWPAANYNVFLNKVGQVVNGFGKISDQLYCFLDRSIQQMSYTGDAVTPFSFPTIAPEIGSVSGQAIVSVDWACFFPSYKGIYFFDGSQPQYISEQIEATWRTINLNRIGQIVGVHNRLYNEVWFAVSTGSSTQNDTVLVYDYVNRNWTVFTGFKPNCAAIFQSSYPTKPIIGDYTGLVLRTNSGEYLDDSSSITAYCKTKPNDFGDPGRKRKVRRLELASTVESVVGASIYIKTGYDMSTPSSVGQVNVSQQASLWDVAVWDSAAFSAESQGVFFYRPGGHGRYFQLEVGANTASQGMEISDLCAWVRGEADEK